MTFGEIEPPTGHLYFWRFEGTSDNLHQIWYSMAPDGTDTQNLNVAPADPQANTKTLGIPSPDGSWIAYFEGHSSLGSYGRLMVSRPDGSEKLDVGEISTSDALPHCRVPVGMVWSPDSSKLAYYSEPAGITVLRAGTWEIIDQFAATSASWSTDNTRLVATMEAPVVIGQRITPDTCLVGIRDIPSRETTILTQGRAPEWSPDGAYVIFSHARSLFLMYPDGSGIRRLAGYGDFPQATVDLGGGYDYPLLDGAWSPGGDKIAVAFDGHVWAIEVASSEKQLLGEAGYGMRWSPDGRWIAYTADELAATVSGIRRGVYLVPADGGLPRQFLAEGELYDWR